VGKLSGINKFNSGFHNKIKEVGMVNELARNWWAVLIRGILALILGLLMIFVPPIITMEILIIFLGAYFLVDGIFSIVAVISGKTPHRWAMLAEGILSIVFGILVFVWPMMTALVLLFVVAIWAIITGIAELTYAGMHWKDGAGKWLLLIAGIISIILGIIILAQPGAGVLALVVFIEAYLIVFGIMLIGLSVWLKSLPMAKA
jgi:uncharacterized membrane protein HdeD (DUF308 family)